jgi:CxxC motif-containing protein (DUF1111 family)
MRLLKLSVVAFFTLALALPFVLRPAEGRRQAAEAPAAFDNQTNGFTDQATFDADRLAFEAQEQIADGLGPTYNAQSCAECHQNPVTGGISQIFELRAGHSGAGGNFVDAPGGSLLQARAIHPEIQERVPDGQRIFFTSFHPLTGSTQIGVMGHDGGQYGFLTDGPLVAGETAKSWPSVSPDNTKIVFQALVSGQWDIFTMTLDGKLLQRLTNVAGDDVNPVWSPDGTKIAFSSRRTGDAELFVMNANGSAQTNITNDQLNHDTEPTWSPDGTQLAFTRTTLGGSADIWKRSSSSGGLPPVRLTNNPGAEGHPSWSPDGTQLAFHRTSGAQSDIFRLPAAGGAETQLTADSFHNTQPAWSPNGSAIAFTSTRGLAGPRVFVMNADGSAETRLLNFGSADSLPAWTTETGENVRTFRASLNILGDGFVECIDDITFHIISNQQPAGMQGTFVMVPVLEVEGCNPEVPSTCSPRIGRFGWKGSVASLLSFSALAYRGEMGITSPLQPKESPSLGRSVKLYDNVADPEDTGGEQGFGEDVEAFTRFMRSTKAPPRDRNLVAQDATDPGSQLFDQIGCNVCHVRSITTAPPGTPINGFTFTVPEALGNKVIHPFGDFLLHNIGTGDGIVEAGGEATRNKVRTAPLWGLRTRDRLMHDGGSSSPPSNSGAQSFTINEAILRHAGEANGVKNSYLALTEMQKRQLIKFLKSL